MVSVFLSWFNTILILARLSMEQCGVHEFALEAREKLECVGVTMLAMLMVVDDGRGSGSVHGRRSLAAIPCPEVGRAWQASARR